MAAPRDPTRRDVLRAGVVLLGAAAWPRAAWGDRHGGLPGAARTSSLIYVSPLRRDGSESRCHGEVWFVADGDALLVVTSRDGWRATAVGRGLARARIWVGDHGVWTKSDAWRSAPSIVARADAVTSSEERERILGLYGAKYADGWGRWGPRFRKGLADGSRVMLRYVPEGS